ncbi:Glucan endo-1-3-beta-glucosidase 13 [Nymphaea thermarum]|nr:Glucan endo-1-3-beta-glucosidase 13 [Nymphaea thermarum]
MANGAIPALLIMRIAAVLLLLSTTPVLQGGMQVVVGQGLPQQMTWCVAKPSTVDSDLINIIQFACSQPEVNCSAFKPGGPCSLPDTYINHASVAMNLYYQVNGRLPHLCYFGGAGLIVIDDPSYGSCKA